MAWNGWGLAALGVVCLYLTSCATQREAKSAVRTRFGIDEKAWGGGGAGGGDDSKEIRSRYAESGWGIDETGQIRPKNEKDANLYAGETVDKGRDFKKKGARLSKREVETELFRTPEYLERQQYRTEEARGIGAAREGAFDDQRASETGRVSRSDGKEAGFLSGLNPFRSEAARESSHTSYRTSSHRQGTRAQENAAVATGVSQSELGFYKDTVRTMDDVKKLLNPEAFD